MFTDQELVELIRGTRFEQVINMLKEGYNSTQIAKSIDGVFPSKVSVICAILDGRLNPFRQQKRARSIDLADRRRKVIKAYEEALADPQITNKTQAWRWVAFELDLGEATVKAILKKHNLIK